MVEQKKEITKYGIDYELLVALKDDKKRDIRLYVDVKIYNLMPNSPEVHTMALQAMKLYDNELARLQNEGVTDAIDLTVPLDFGDTHLLIFSETETANEESFYIKIDRDYEDFKAV